MHTSSVAGAVALPSPKKLPPLLPKLLPAEKKPPLLPVLLPAAKKRAKTGAKKLPPLVNELDELV